MTAAFSLWVVAPFVSAAPLDCVVSVFGGGGLKDERGLAAAFGGAVYFKDEESGQQYLGVWGARKLFAFPERASSIGRELRDKEGAAAGPSRVVPKEF